MGALTVRRRSDDPSSFESIARVVRRALRSSRRAKLTTRETQVLDRRYGGDLFPSLEDIGKDLGVSGERVRQLECAGLRRLGIERVRGRPRANPTHPFARWLVGRELDAIAEELGVALRTLHHLAAGRRRPSLPLAARIERLTRGEIRAVDWVLISGT